MSGEFKPRIRTALSLEIGGVVLSAEIDEKAGTARIVQSGSPINGEAKAIEQGRELLVQRVRRFLPTLKVVG